MPRAEWATVARAVFEIPHPTEQRKMADMLFSVDTKIQAVSDQILKMETFRKSLVQQMFV